VTTDVFCDVRACHSPQLLTAFQRGFWSGLHLMILYHVILERQRGHRHTLLLPYPSIIFLGGRIRRNSGQASSCLIFADDCFFRSCLANFLSLRHCFPRQTILCCASSLSTQALRCFRVPGSECFLLTPCLFSPGTLCVAVLFGLPLRDCTVLSGADFESFHSA